jgi:hypothetical protein
VTFSGPTTCGGAPVRRPRVDIGTPWLPSGEGRLLVSGVGVAPFGPRCRAAPGDASGLGVGGCEGGDALVGVQSARVRHHPERGAGEVLGLTPGRRPRAAESRAVRRDPEHRRHQWAVGGHEGLEPGRALGKLLRGELVGAGRRPAYQVGDADPTAYQLGEIVLGHPGQAVSGRWQDPGRDQGRAEAVGRVAEVDLRRRRAQPRVDPDEDQSDPVGDEVGHLDTAEGLELGSGEAGHGRQRAMTASLRGSRPARRGGRPDTGW